MLKKLIDKLCFWRKSKKEHEQSEAGTEEAGSSTQRILKGARSDSIGETRVVRMGKEDVAVEPMPLGRFLDTITRLNEFPALVAYYLKDGSKFELLTFVVSAISQVREEFFDIVELASGLDREYIVDEVTVPQMVRFLKVLYEVNEGDYLKGELIAAGKTLTKQVMGLVEEIRQANHADPAA